MERAMAKNMKKVVVKGFSNRRVVPSTPTASISYIT